MGLKLQAACVFHETHSRRPRRESVLAGEAFHEELHRPTKESAGDNGYFIDVEN